MMQNENMHNIERATMDQNNRQCKKGLKKIEK